MMPPEHRDARRKAVLRIAILDITLALRTHDAVGKVRHARRRWCAHDRRHGRIVAGRPANLCQVEPRVLRAAVIAEPAYVRVERKHRCRSGSVSVTGSECVRIVTVGTTANT